MLTLSNARVVELRRYQLRSPAHVDVLHDLFERHLIAGQSAAGIQVGLLYRDVDAPEMFVWWRGFVDMPARRTALADFYDGPVWEEHRDVANGTMLDSDDALLLRWATQSPSAGMGGRDKDYPAAATMIIRNLVQRDGEEIATRVGTSLRARLGSRVSVLLTECSVNDFTRLPVRSEPTLVWHVPFSTAHQRDDAVAALSADAEWIDLISDACGDVETDIELLRLATLSHQRSADW